MHEIKKNSRQKDIKPIAVIFHTFSCVFFKEMVLISLEHQETVKIVSTKSKPQKSLIRENS